MKHATTRQLHQYWNELRGLRAAPERDSIEPGAIANILPDVFILETDAALTFPFRVSGARTNALFDAQLKGHPFLGLWRQADRQSVQAMLLTVLDGACPMIAGVRAAPEGYPGVEMELLLLPLRLHGKTHARLLGCLSPARHPHWLGLLPATSLELVSMRVVRADRDVFPLPARDADRPADRGFATAGRRPRLTVYEGGRATERT